MQQPTIVENKHRRTVRASVQRAPQDIEIERPRFTFIDNDSRLPAPNSQRHSQTDFSFLGHQTTGQSRVSSSEEGDTDSAFHTPPPSEYHFDHSLTGVGPFAHNQANASSESIRISIESGRSPLDRLSSSLQSTPLAIPRDQNEYFNPNNSNYCSFARPIPPFNTTTTTNTNHNSANMLDSGIAGAGPRTRLSFVGQGEQLMSSQTIIPENDPEENFGSSEHMVEKEPYVRDNTASDSSIVAAGAGAGAGAGAAGYKKPRKRSCMVWTLVAIAGIIIVLVAVLVPVGVVVINKDDHKSNNQASHSGSHTSASPSSPSSTPKSSVPESAKGTVLDPATWLTHEDFNTTYTSEEVGGLSVMGLNNTWDDSAQCNPNVPPLNEPFPYGEKPIRGVNVGGWLVLEPFITPSFFSNASNPPIVDEWTLVESLVKKDEANSSLKDDGNNFYVKEKLVSAKAVLENHYKTFITENTFKEIAAAGLDHVRIPFGYWALKTYSGDMFLPQVSWRYLLRGIEYCRKYGLRVNLDFHAVPGSQNGWNHSGRQGYPLWLNSTTPNNMGQVYGNRSLELHDQLSQFFAQDRYRNIVTFYGLVNEPKCQALNATVVTEWSQQAYDIVRKNKYENHVVYGDGFIGAGSWEGTFPPDKYPNMTLDIHQYTIFDSYLINLPHAGKVGLVCNEWPSAMNQSGNPTVVGEWSQADNDCTPNLNNVGVGTRWEGTFDQGYGSDPILQPSCAAQSNCTCKPSTADPSTYSAEYKAFLLQFAELQMDAFESGGGWGSWYWTWITEDPSATQWSYKRGIDAGIMPKVAYKRTYKCSTSIPDYTALGLPENY